MAPVTPDIPTWLNRMLIHNGANCHLCGLCVDITVGTNYRLSASRDHLIPNPLTKKSGYHKRSVVDPDHEVNQTANILLSHRWCNSARGQLEVTADLRENIRLRITELYQSDKFTELQNKYE